MLGTAPQGNACRGIGSEAWSRTMLQAGLLAEVAVLSMMQQQRGGQGLTSDIMG